MSFPQEGKTQLVISIGNMSDIQTYSEGTIGECYIDEQQSSTDYYDLYVLVFDTTGKYKWGRAVLKTAVSGINGASTRTMTVPLLLENEKVVVLINTGVDNSSTTQGLAALTVGTSTVTDINTAFTSDAWNINQATSDSGKGMPMSGEITSFKPSESRMNVYRSVAKIQLSVSSTVELASGITSFDDSSVTWAMANDATKGAIYSGTPQQTEGTVVPTSNSFHTLVEDDFIRYGNTYDGTNDQKVYYLPEYTSSTLAKGTTVGNTTFAANRVCMVIKHNGKYYRIDLAQKQTDGSYKYLDLKRNCHYTVNISKVKALGYDSFEEALANPPSNIEYEIVVTGSNDNVIVSNGQYAMSLECDNLVAYADASTEMTINVRAIMGSGSATLPTTNSITPSTGITMTGATTLTATDQDIKFTMSGSSGSITVKLGNLTRVVSITRNDPLDSHYNHKTIAGEYVGITWTKNNNNSTATINGTASLTFHTGENVTPLNTSALTDATVEPVFDDLKTEFYAASNIGCTKVVIMQNAPDYVGWAGGTPDQDGDTYFSKRLVTETIGDGAWGGSGTLNMQWGTSTSATNTQDGEDGKANTKVLNTSSYPAAYSCWMKNDANGDGTVTQDEFNAAGWYLPAKYQLMRIWTSYPNFLYKNWGNNYFWCSTESKSSTSEAFIVAFRFGHVYTATKTKTYEYANILARCVRDI